MRTHTRFSSLFTASALCMVLSPIAGAEESAENGKKYVDLEVSLPADCDAPTIVLVLASGQLTTMNAGVFNGYMPPLTTTGTTNVQIFDRTNPSGVPANAKVTKVEIQSSRTAVQGMTHFVQIGKGADPQNINYAPNIAWAATVNTSYFDGQHPAGYWVLRFYATRIIVDPVHDNGAGITITSATIRVYWEN